MAIPSNTLVQVQTYQRSMLGRLNNLNCLVGEVTNKRFKDFPGIKYNLGSSVTFDLPPLFTSNQGLVAVWQPANQRQVTLTCDQAQIVPYAFTAQDKIFNVDKDVDSYMQQYGDSATDTLGSKMEINLALNANSSVPVMTVNSQGQSVPTGALHTESGPYSFYGNGVTALTSYQQLDQMIENFRERGSTNKPMKVILPNITYPAIIASGLTQFAPDRNNKIANSWEVGEFGSPSTKFYRSNMLPVQVAGTIGNTAAPNNLCTVVSTNDPTGANITQITFTEPTSGTDASAVKAGDLFQFKDGVSGKPNLRFLTRIGNNITSQPVQFRVTADAATTAGTFTVTVTPALQSTQGATQNINANIVVGMQATPLPSHKCGLLVDGDAFFVAMPQLPSQKPFDTGNEVDPETNASIRMTTGATFAQNQYGTTLDATWGSLLVPEYSMRIILPL